MNKKTTLSAIVAVLMSVVCLMTSCAQEIDGIKYELNDGEVTIGYNFGIEGDLVIPSSVSYNGKDCPVTSIGNYAFSDCIGLTSVVIPESVTSIGERAFARCSGLTSVVIPESVTSIGTDAFSECIGLTFIVIPASVTSIRSAVFARCSSLTSIVIPASVTSIRNYAFESCSSLTSVVIPESVTSIGEGAFRHCSSLSSIEVSPDNVNYISVDGVLYTKDKSELCVFPNGKKVTSFVILESVTSIGEGAFSGCSGLTSVVIPKGVTSIGEGAFSGCSGLISVVIPKGVTSIGSSAFSGCSGLTSVVIPEGVTSIGIYVFSGCTGLSSVVIPDSVTSISDGAFFGCSDLTSVVIPESVTSIGYNAFQECNLLTSIYSKSFEPPVCGGYCFDGIPSDAVAYVPIGSKAAYEDATGWQNLTIEEYNFTDVASPSVALPFTAYAISGGVVLSATEDEAEVAVYNLQGVELYRGTVSVGETVVALPSGSYVVRADGGKGTLVLVP